MKKEFYVARDKNGSLYAFTKEPVKDEHLGEWRCEGRWYSVYLPGMSDVKWEDDKPHKITVTLSK